MISIVLTTSFDISLNVIKNDSTNGWFFYKEAKSFPYSSDKTNKRGEKCLMVFIQDMT